MLTTVKTVYYVKEGSPPAMVDNRWAAPYGDGYPFHRPELPVGAQWVHIDVGWVDVVGMLVLVNREGVFTKTYPTAEEVRLAQAKVVEVGVEGSDEPLMSIAPGRSLDLEYPDLSRLMLRCREGTAGVEVWAFPGIRRMRGVPPE